MLSSFRGKIPFTYFWIFRRFFTKDIKTVLDLGCSDGRILEFVFDGNIPKLDFTGVDLYKGYLEGAGQKKIYKKLIMQDLTKNKWKEIDGKKYDLVLCSQLIEHLNKKQGGALLKKMDQLASKRIAVGTPNGFQKFSPLEENILNEYESNESQEHKSGWAVEDFTKRGFKVYGQGLNFVYKADSLIRRLPKSTHILFFIISFALSPLIYFVPQIAYNLVAIKEK